MESSLVVLPRVLPESKLSEFSRRFEHSIRKSVQDSLWLVERAHRVDTYSEQSLHPWWRVKRQIQQAREDAVAALAQSARQEAAKGKREASDEDPAGSIPEKRIRPDPAVQQNVSSFALKPRPFQHHHRAPIPQRHADPIKA